MGWASASTHFYPVASALYEAEADDNTRFLVCKALISTLQDGDWDTADEVLGEYVSDEAIVRAFRECGVYVHCNKEHEDGERYYSCDLETGHSDDHKDSWFRKTWTDVECIE